MLDNADLGLFIGVNDYSAYDRSVDNRKGTSDLPGSIHDAKTFWRVARWLGMRPENLRIVTSPKIDPAELEGATADNVGEATEQGILAGVGWLATGLANRPERAALMTYSGHGAYEAAKGLLLCPSNTEGADLKHAIPFSTLSELLRPVGENLTSVLDCCHAGAVKGRPPSGSEGRLLSIGGAEVPSSVMPHDLAFAGRVLSACRPQETTQQARFMGRWAGAFTWAVASAMEQWKSVPDGAGRRLDVTYGTLASQAAALLQTLSLQGTPQVTGPRGVRDLAVLQRGTTPAETTEDPDGVGLQLQLDPGGGCYRWYTIRDNNGVTYANVLVPRTEGQIGGSGTTYMPGTEYWFNVITSRLSSSTSLQFLWTDYSSWSSGPSLGTQSFTMPRTPRTVGASQPPHATDTFVNNSLGASLRWDIYKSGSVWFGDLYWYTLTTTGEVNNNIFQGSTSGQVMTGSTTASRWEYTYVYPGET
ncbi:MAG: caspase family protein [Polyangiaceae bacterium]